RDRPWQAPEGGQTTPHGRRPACVLPFRHLRERFGPLRPLLLRRPRVREGRITRDRDRVRPSHGLPRRRRHVAVRPPRRHGDRVAGILRTRTFWTARTSGGE